MDVDRSQSRKKIKCNPNLDTNHNCLWGLFLGLDGPQSVTDVFYEIYKQRE